MLGLRAFGTELPANQALCPKTWRLLLALERHCRPRRLTTAGFSRLAPGATILPHADLAGRTPPTRGDGCWPSTAPHPALTLLPLTLLP